MIEYLNYGAMGLGLALMILSYRLLSNEAARDVARNKILFSIFSFFGLSLLIFSGGIYLEINQKKHNESLPINTSTVPALSKDQVIHVESIKDENPAFQKVYVEKDARIFDLRSYVNLSNTDTVIKESKVNMTRYMLLKKESHLDALRVRFATSGKEVRIRCLTHKCQYYKKQEKEVEPIDLMNKGRKLTQQWDVSIDISNYKTNESFIVIIEATYINAFQGENRWWVGALADYNTSEINLLVIFPETSPFKFYGLKSGPRHLAHHERPPYDGVTNIFPGPKNNTLYWRINKPAQDTVYGIDWTW